MELFRTDTHYIFVKERHSLWCEKYTGELSAKSGKFVLSRRFSVKNHYFSTTCNNSPMSMQLLYNRNS